MKKEQLSGNKGKRKEQRRAIVLLCLLFIAFFSFSCDNGTLGGADITNIMSISRKYTWTDVDKNQYNLEIKEPSLARSAARAADPSASTFTLVIKMSSSASSVKITGTATDNGGKIDFAVTGGGEFSLTIIGDGDNKINVEVEIIVAIKDVDIQGGEGKEIDGPFQERMNFFCGDWDSGYGDGYFIRKWGNLTEKDKGRIQQNFPDVDLVNLQTYGVYGGDGSDKKKPTASDYIIMYPVGVAVRGGSGEDMFGGGTTYLGLVRTINIFNGDKNKGAIIIEYFENGDPLWLGDGSYADGSIPGQGLKPGEKPFFGIYYRVLNANKIQFANAVNLAAMYAGYKYYTEKGTLKEAVGKNTVQQDAEYISWGIVMPVSRQP